MRTQFIAFLILMLNTVSCNAQEPINDTITQKYNKMKRPVLTDSYEKLDLRDFKDGIILKKENIEVDADKWEDIDMYYYNKEDDKQKIYLSGNYIGGFGYTYTQKDSYYISVKTYHPNGVIKRKWIESFLGKGPKTKLGKEYCFNEAGQLTETIDHDAGWDFPFEDALQYILKRGYDVKFPNEISAKETKKNRKYWELLMYTHEEEVWEIVKLDGKTGEILAQSEYKGDRMFRDNVLHSNVEKIIVPDKTENISSGLIKNNTPYKTYQGKDYTQEEWKAFEQTSEEK